MAANSKMRNKSDCRPRPPPPKGLMASQAARSYFEWPLQITVMPLTFVFPPKAISPPFQAGSAPILTCRTPASHNQGRS